MKPMPEKLQKLLMKVRGDPKLTGIKIPLKARLNGFLKNHLVGIFWLIERIPIAVLCLFVTIILLRFSQGFLLNLLTAVALFFLYKEIVSDIILIKKAGDKKAGDKK